MKSFTVSELAQRVNGTVHGDASARIDSLAPIATATKNQLTYLVNSHYEKYLPSTQAQVVLLSAQHLSKCSTTSIVVDHPELAYATIAQLFVRPSAHKTGVHKTAVVGDHCTIDPSVSIGASCVIGVDVTLGENTVIMPGVIIEDRAQIGANTVIHSNVTIGADVMIGSNVIIYAGVVIGSDGFGYAQSPEGWVKIPQLGTVIIEDNVEIGANTTIDRGALENTIIRRGVKIDNLVQVAHNVDIGENTIVAGCAGFAGSAKIGRNCMIGGGACINGHISIADDVIVMGMAGVMRTIDEPGMYVSGFHAHKHNEWGRIVARVGQLGKMADRIKKLEKALASRGDNT